jgi:hypothetical protein
MQIQRVRELKNQALLTAVHIQDQIFRLQFRRGG